MLHTNRFHLALLFCLALLLAGIAGCDPGGGVWSAGDKPAVNTEAKR